MALPRCRHQKPIFFLCSILFSFFGLPNSRFANLYLFCYVLFLLISPSSFIFGPRYHVLLLLQDWWWLCLNLWLLFIMDFFNFWVFVLIFWVLLCIIFLVCIIIFLIAVIMFPAIAFSVGHCVSLSDIDNYALKNFTNSLICIHDVSKEEKLWKSNLAKYET